MKIKSLVIGWGEGASVYWANDKISIEDCSYKREDGTKQTYFNVYTDKVLTRTIIGLPVNIEYYPDCPLEDAKEADDA